MSAVLSTLGVLAVFGIVIGGIVLFVVLVRTMVRDGWAAEQRRNQQAAAPQANQASTNTSGSEATDANSDDIDGMNEGDYRNGPGGYTTGAYETSFYGTIYERDLDHDEEDERH